MLTTDQIERITALIDKQGPTGVNAIHRQACPELPLSTLDNYLKKGSVFKQHSSRKWDIHSNVVTNQVNGDVKELDSVIQAQLDGISAMWGMMDNNIKTVITLIQQNQRQARPSVANAPKERKMPVSWEEVYISVTNNTKALKYSYVNMSEEFQMLFNNTDWYKLYLYEGVNTMMGGYLNKLVDLLGQTSVSPDIYDEVTQVMNKYQKEDKK